MSLHIGRKANPEVLQDGPFALSLPDFGKSCTNTHTGHHNAKQPKPSGCRAALCPWQAMCRASWQAAGLWQHQSGHCRVRNCCCDVQSVFLGEARGSADCVISIFICKCQHRRIIKGCQAVLQDYACVLVGSSGKHKA